MIQTLARTINFGSVPFRTGTIADSTSDRYTLSTTGAFLTLGAPSQHTFTINDLVGRLTLAFDAVAFCN